LLKREILKVDSDEKYVKFHGTPTSRNGGYFSYCGLQIACDKNIFDPSFEFENILRFSKSNEGPIYKHKYDIDIQKGGSGKWIMYCES
jgi:hypothetical protein